MGGLLLGASGGSRNPSTWRSHALQHFREILHCPDSFQRVTDSKGTTFLEKMLPDGRGIRLFNPEVIPIIAFMVIRVRAVGAMTGCD